MSFASIELHLMTLFSITPEFCRLFSSKPMFDFCLALNITTKDRNLENILNE